MSQFSTNESTSLEQKIDLQVKKSDIEKIDFLYEIDKCAEWILRNNFKKVCLQFPDYLLPDSASVVHKLENVIQNKVYILGDTAYGSCCIDYTAAKHISADGIIHFGPVCFSQQENIIPSLIIHEKFEIDISKFCSDVRNKFTNDNITIIINSPYLYKIDDIKEKLSSENIKIQSVNVNLDINKEIIVYLGENNKKLLNIYLSFSSNDFYYFDPQRTNNLLVYKPENRILKRRYYLIEKIKDSNVIGIVINTLAVKNYLKIIDRIKRLATIHDKKYYVISVGKPTVAKLANFPEVEIFVAIGCALNEIYENGEYYQPIVTPFDFESALNPNFQNVRFSYDFNKFLTDNDDLTPDILKNYNQYDVSLITGKVRAKIEKSNECTTSSSTIATKDEGTVQLHDNYGAGFLGNRSWKGLEQDLGKDEPQLAVKGRKGIAQNYENEY